MSQKFNRYQRTTSRLGVVQMLFVSNIRGEAVEVADIVAMFDESWEKPDMRFMQSRYESVGKNRNTIDDCIQKGLREGWKLEGLDKQLYAILTVATDEMLSPSRGTTPEILVKEYVDLSADFFSGAEVSFVNAYLNDLKKKQEPS